MDFRTKWMNRRIRKNVRVMIDVEAKVMMNLSAFEGEDEGGVLYTLFQVYKRAFGLGAHVNVKRQGSAKSCTTVFFPQGS